MDCFIYKIHNSDGEVVYVGQTTNIESRIKQHKCRFDEEFSSHTHVKCDMRDADNLEAIAIVKHNPKYNRILPKNSIYIRGNEMADIIKGVLPQIIAEQDAAFFGVSNNANTARWYDTIDLDLFVKHLKARLECNQKMENVKIKITVE